MEVALITLGGFLIIASFEIHFRYLGIAREYYENCLREISEKLDSFLKEKKQLADKNERQLGSFLDELADILSDFSQRKITANVHNHLFYGFLLEGVYIAFIGVISDYVIEAIKIDPLTPMMFVIMFGIVFLVPVSTGLQSLRKITKIR